MGVDFASVALHPALISCAGLLPLRDAPLLLQGFGFFQFYSILWFWQGAPINKSSYISLNMVSTANYIYGIGNTSNWEWCGRSLLLLGNHLESKAANCYSGYDSSLTPELFCCWNWETRGILKWRWICFREKIQILSMYLFSKLVEKKRAGKGCCNN